MPREGVGVSVGVRVEEHEGRPLHGHRPNGPPLPAREGGGCGIVDNIKIESKVRINPMTYVTKSIKKPGTYSGGSIVLEHSKWLKHITIQKKRFDD